MKKKKLQCSVPTFLLAGVLCLTLADCGLALATDSAASAALAELEEALGASLFDRVGRRLVLNANGRALLAPAQAMLEQAGDIQSLFKSERGAHIRVAASFTIGEYCIYKPKKHPPSRRYHRGRSRLNRTKQDINN